jgi:hypothetical protein
MTIGAGLEKNSSVTVREILLLLLTLIILDIFLILHLDKCNFIHSFEYGCTGMLPSYFKTSLG